MKISVCMATYNGEKYIKEQLESILSQIKLNDEIIISDDGSKDQTIKIIESLGDLRIKIFYNNGEKGYTKNFENALINSTGDIIFLSDQDDIWVNNKVKLMLSELEQHDLVISDAEIVNHKLELLNKSYFSLRGKRNSFIGILYKTDFLGCCMAFNRKILEMSLPFPKNTEMCPHDLWLGLIGYSFFSVKKLDDKLILYRRHGNNISAGGMKGGNILFKVRYRIYVILEIIVRRFSK